MFHPQDTDILVVSLCIILHLTFRFWRRSTELPLPPGPRRWPIIGSALSFPMKYAGREFAQMSKQYGSKILYHEAFGRPMVILNDLQMAKDLLEKRSLSYSSRPQLTMVKEIMNIDFFLGNMPYGSKWRHQRRLLQQYFSPHDMETPQEIEVEFIRKSLLPKLYEQPHQFREAISGCFGGISTLMTYGVPVHCDHDPLVQLVEEAFTNVALAVVPGAFLVEIVPWLQYIPDWVPGAGFKHKGREWGKLARRALEEPFLAAQEALAHGSARKSFVSASLERSGHPYTEHEATQVKEAASMIFGAASETTTSSFLTFILAMLKHPEVLSKAQRELDSVMGDRLPEFSDKASLPYLAAVLKEVLRWNPIVPIGLPHLTHEEDIYSGYYIPANSLIIGNAYAILHDEDVYEDPEAFNPGRYLKNGQLSFQAPDPEVVATFGFGRRICPGAHVANSTLFMAAASVLSLFDISYDIDESGQPIDAPLAFAPTGAVSQPLPFSCKITPRAGKNVEDLLKEYRDVKVIA